MRWIFGGFETVSNKFFDVAVKAINYYFENISDDDLEIWVGTNEQVFFGKDFLRDFIVTDITPQQEAQLLVMFGNNAKGECLFERLLDTALDNIPQTDKNFETFLKELEEDIKRLK